jgi:hypothetical protein
MTNLTTNRLWFIAALAISCNFCFAQPSGQFSLDFDNTTPLIDMNGDFSVADQIIGADSQTIPLNFAVGINHRSNGAILGAGGTIVFIGNDAVAAAYRASGRVSGGGDNLQVFLTVNLKGEGIVAGRNTKFSIVVAYRLIFSSDNGDLEGSSRGRANFAGLGGGTIRSDGISVGLPGGGDGSWSINMNVVPFKRLSGSAQIILSGGRPVNGALSGHFFEGSGFSVLRFAGTDSDRGTAATFSFTTTNEGTNLETVHGKILGQRVIF